MKKGFQMGKNSRIPSPRGRARVGGCKKPAVTLAEVLITLGVIGVVAAMTMPTIIKNYQKQATVNKLKETYSTLSQAFQRAVVEHGEPINWTYGDENYFVENYLAPYIKIVNKSTDAPKHYYLSGSEIRAEFYKNHTHYYLANGVEITVRPYSTTYYMIMADLNGKKGPNMFGKDLFKFQFSKDSKTTSLSKTFILNGFYNSLSNIKSNCNKNSDGDYCGAWIMIEGWKIPDDYPW